MPIFPDTKNDIVILAAKVAAGINDNPADYPNPPFDPAPMNLDIGEAIQLIGQRQAKNAEAKALLDQENAKIADVSAKLRTLLNEAETRYPTDAAKLQEIGWDVPSERQYLKPGEVRNLEAIAQGPGTVELDWKAPARTAHTGRPTIYKITRETRNIETHAAIEEFGTWESTAFETETLLSNQPRGVEISYRLTASNTNGDGPPVEAQRAVL
jgi:hypothetical protein